MKHIYVPAFLLLALYFTSCMTLQDDIQTTVSDSEVDATSMAMEYSLIEYDAEYLNSAGSFISPAKQQALSSFITRLDVQIAAARSNRELLTRLYALQGRAYLLQGNTAKAAELYTAGRKIQPGDPQVLILGIRRQKTAELRLEKLEQIMAISDDQRPLVLEMALAYFENGDYSNAAAYFDEAFLLLPNVYRSSYASLREKAWLLKDSSSTSGKSSISSYLIADAIDVYGMLAIANAESDAFSADIKSTSARPRQLLSIARRKNWLTEESAETPSSPVHRADAAFLLWNIYRRRHALPAEKADYQKIYAAEPESPIPDVPVESPIFSSAAGCIEYEIMPLPDGIHFRPEYTVKGSDFLNWLKNTGK